MVRSVVLPTPRWPKTPTRWGRHIRSTSKAAVGEGRHIGNLHRSCEDEYGSPLVIRGQTQDIRQVAQERSRPWVATHVHPRAIFHGGGSTHDVPRDSAGLFSH